MAAQQWTEKQTNEVMRKVIRRAEVSRIARLLQHRLALANVKTQNGWENLTLDAIEPKVEETLQRKRHLSSVEKSPSPQLKTFFSEADVDWRRRTHPSTSSSSRPASRADSIGPLPTFPRTSTTTRKRPRDPTHPPTTTTTTTTTKRPRRPAKPPSSRLIQSSPGYYDLPRAKHPHFHSSPPRTPPRYIRRAQKPGAAAETHGADLLLFLATSPSPAMPRSRFIPTTPPSRQNAVLPSSMMQTPGPTTPQTGFNFADFVNITPSPAQGAFGGAVGQGRGTPIANARRRLNFDQLVPPTGEPPGKGVARGGVELGGELVS